MNEVPAAVQRIITAHNSAPRQRGPRPIRHTIEFAFDMQPGIVIVARMQATSALPVPDVGQHISLYSTPVEVTQVDTHYKVGDSGETEVMTSILIMPVE